MLIDFHAHPDLYNTDIKSVLSEIREERILTIANALDIPSYERNLEIAEECEFVIPIFGIHPWRAPKYVERFDQLEYLADQSPMIGEVGLDYHFVEDKSCFPAQKKVLEFFLFVAKRSDKIVTLHTKGAEDEICGLLSRHRVRRVVVHWYSGPMDVFRELLKANVYFTIGAEVLSSKFIQKLAQELPYDRLLVETDNPGGPEWLFGTQGRPRLLIDIMNKVAELRKKDYEEIVETVLKNFMELTKNDTRLEKVRCFIKRRSP